jgi:3-phenylpropionate/trans-cinnamate dioxygenase ferredoxin subunit
MAKHIVGTVDEIGPGQRKIIEVEGVSLGVFNVGGTFYALRNRCPHQGAPLCRGSLKGTALPSVPGEYVWAREGEILRCPWHGWEFDVTNGRSLFNPHRVRVRAYEVTVESPAPGEEEDPRVETFPVTVEADRVVVHLDR